MYQVSNSSLQLVVGFFANAPLALICSHERLRQAAESSVGGIRIGSNSFTAVEKKHRGWRLPHDRFETTIRCRIEDALGAVYARWWLRRRTSPEVEWVSRRMCTQLSPHDQATHAMQSIACDKGCFLSIRYASTGPALGNAVEPVYLLSLGELMSFGQIERLELDRVVLQPTGPPLALFLSSSVGLQSFIINGIALQLNELVTLMQANSASLTTVELSNVGLPTLKVFWVCSAIQELQLCGTHIGAGEFGQSEHLTEDSAEDLASLKHLVRLDMRCMPRSIDFSGLQLCASLESLNLSATFITPQNIADISLLKLHDLWLSRCGVDDVQALCACGTLRALHLSNTPLTTAGIHGLGRLPLLQYLDLSGTAVSDVHTLADTVSLKTLNLRKTEVTSAGIMVLRNLPVLETLLLGDNAIDTVGFLGASESIRVLNIQSTLVRSEGIAGLEQLRSLEELDLSHTPITDVSRLSSLPRLRKLEAFGAMLDSAGISNLSAIPTLEVLLLSQTNLTNINGLNGAPSITELTLKRCSLDTDNAIMALGSLYHLMSLTITHCKVTSVNILGECKKLKSLNLWATAVSLEGIQALDGITSLKKVDLAETNVTHITPLLSSEQLQSLILYNSALESIEGAQQLKLLKYLDLQNTRITSVCCLGTCLSLEELNITDTRVDDSGFQGIERISSLKKLFVASTLITSLGALGACPLLEELYAAKSPISSKGIEGLERSRRLSKLFLPYTQVKSGVKRLGAITSLRKLNLKFTGVSVEELTCLKQLLPRCRISEHSEQVIRKKVQYP